MFNSFMKLALDQAKLAGEKGEVPIGAVVVDGTNNILAQCHNRTRELSDPSAHAEILAIRLACQAINSNRLIGCSLHVTLEPCPMCASAISFARIKTLYYGCSDKKSGGIETGPCIFSHTQLHHKPEIFNGFLEEEISTTMKHFFSKLRETKA